jgi:hypothetical protein
MKNIFFSARLREHLSRLKNKPQLKRLKKYDLKKKKNFAYSLTHSLPLPLIHSFAFSRKTQLIEPKNVQHTLHLSVFSLSFSISHSFSSSSMSCDCSSSQTISLWIQVMILYLHRTIYSLIFRFLFLIFVECHNF